MQLFQENSQSQQAYKSYFEKAQKSLKSADHLAYITYPLLKDARLLKKIIEDIFDCLDNLVKTAVEYDYLNKKIGKYGDDKINRQNFLKKSSLRFGLNQQEVDKISLLLELMDKYRGTSFDFIRHDKLVMMADNLRTEIITFNDTKEILGMIKVINTKIKRIVFDQH